MKSLDAANKAPVKNKKKPSNRKKTRTNTKKKATREPRVDMKSKNTMMWTLVSVFMIIVIVGWVTFLRYSLEDDLHKRGGGLDSIVNSFNNMFNVVDSDVDEVQDIFAEIQELQEQIKEGDEVTEEVLELREQVFPQFENTNTNSK